MRLWNVAGACLKRSAGTAEKPGALWDGILCVNCENSLKVFTAVCCTVLHCVAACCSMLQCVAVCCNVLRVLQCVTVC